MPRPRAALVVLTLIVALTGIVPWSARADGTPTVGRVAGADRYKTAALLSSISFSPGVPVAFVATGQSTPDALAAGPAAGKLRGPVLLTRSDVLPAPTSAELRRLRPDRIVIVGGPDTVSAAVEGQLRSLTAGTLDRIQGKDRYATAVAISAATFPAFTDTVYVTSGTTFSDALAAAPATGRAPGDAPLLFLPYNKVDERPELAAELRRLAPQHIVILGGPSAVSQRQETRLAAFSGKPVVRLAGNDPSLTSVVVSAATFSSAPAVYLASEKNFTDALAAGSPASIGGAPILLVEPSCIPPAVDAEIDRLRVRSVALLGAESTLSAAVARRVVCGSASPSTTAPQPAATLPPVTTATTSVLSPLSTILTPISTRCGPAIAKADGSAWTCTFADEFDGTTLNGDRWVAQQTANSGYTSGGECYLDSPNNVAVAGGTLRLTVRKEPAPFTCLNPNGNYITQYTGGMVSTAFGFSQTYGRFEVRAKLPAATVKGLQTALWLWPTNATKYGYWPGSGEIDIAEYYTQYPDRMIPYIHYNDGGTDLNVTNNWCLIATPTEFHSYVAEWTPTTITIVYDGVTCLIDTLQPGHPFDQPFMVALTQALGILTNAADVTTPVPATTQIDYVHVWR
jgi:beta-glucanase (GH16 family)/putative cell wall-binding protein